MVDVHKNTSFVEGNYRDKLVIVLHSIIDNYLKTSLIQVKRHKCTQIHQLIISISIQSMHVYHNYYKTIFTFFLYFYKKNKKIFHIDDIDVNKILVSEKEPYGKNNLLIYFIGYNDNGVIRPLCLKISNMTGYINEFNENKKNNKNVS